MKFKTSIHDFVFHPVSNGQHYFVQYTSPRTGKTWVNATFSSTLHERHNLIDKTKNSEKPTQKALNNLKSFCKKGVENAFIV